MFGKCMGKIIKLNFSKNMQPFDVMFMYTLIVKLSVIFNNALTYCWIVIALMCQKVTLTLVYIVKYMGVYILSNSIQLNILGKKFV